MSISAADLLRIQDMVTAVAVVMSGKLDGPLAELRAQSEAEAARRMTEIQQAQALFDERVRMAEQDIATKNQRLESQRAEMEADVAARRAEAEQLMASAKALAKTADELQAATAESVSSAQATITDATLRVQAAERKELEVQAGAARLAEAQAALDKRLAAFQKLASGQVTGD